MPYLQEKGNEDSTILRIMRTRLRQTLLSRVQPEYLQYGKICTSAVPAAEAGQPVQLSFADGTKSECDLLVVADGANSKLRTALLPHEFNRYAGICMLFVRPCLGIPDSHNVNEENMGLQT
jgi:2-polyprenyl-6-methoxyphenol hydroxylase-like FAD-dependent oxidoreductase